VPWDSPVGCLGGPFTNRHGIDNLTPWLPSRTGVLGASEFAPRPQMLPQLLIENAAGLDEQALVDGFVGHVHLGVTGALAEPARNLLGRPL